MDYGLSWPILNMENVFTEFFRDNFEHIGSKSWIVLSLKSPLGHLILDFYFSTNIAITLTVIVIHILTINLSG